MEVEICERFGWDYETYLRQPDWFIRAIVEKMKAENKRMEREQQKARRM